MGKANVMPEWLTDPNNGYSFEFTETFAGSATKFKKNEGTYKIEIVLPHRGGGYLIELTNRQKKHLQFANNFDRLTFDKFNELFNLIK